MLFLAFLFHSLFILPVPCLPALCSYPPVCELILFLHSFSLFLQCHWQLAPVLQVSTSLTTSSMYLQVLFPLLLPWSLWSLCFSSEERRGYYRKDRLTRRASSAWQGSAKWEWLWNAGADAVRLVQQHLPRVLRHRSRSRHIQPTLSSCTCTHGPQAGQGRDADAAELTQALWLCLVPSGCPLLLTD